MSTSPDGLGGGPFRDDGLLTCPRCGTGFPQAPPPRASSCPRGCGEWLDEATLRALAVHDVVNAVPREAMEAKPFHCPRCSAAMTRHGTNRITLRRCAPHGLWLNARVREIFDAVFDVSGRRVHVDVLTSLLLHGSREAAGRIAARIVELEHAVAELQHQVAGLLAAREP